MWPDIREDTECCANCKHYIQHYHWFEHYRRFDAVNCGHCRYPRIKNRRPTDVCKHFEREKKA